MNNYGGPPGAGYNDQQAGYGQQMPPGYGGGAEEFLQGWLPDTDESNGLSAIPAGSYPAVVTDVVPKDTRSGGTMWAITLEIADMGPYHGRKLFYNMNWTDGQNQISGGIGFTQMALKAMGIQYQSQAGIAPLQVRKSDIVGKRVLAIVSIQQSGQYAGRNQTDRLEPLTVAGPGGIVPANPAPAGFPGQGAIPGQGQGGTGFPAQSPQGGYPPPQQVGGYPPPQQGQPQQQYPQQPPPPQQGYPQGPQQGAPGGRPPGIDF